PQFSSNVMRWLTLLYMSQLIALPSLWKKAWCGQLHEGVYRDLERQKYKEHFNLLDKDTTLAIQLETENSKMLMTRKPQA
uniref:Uncharacterized protein n=1 Tax=Pseudonaja textilis TaxID=8673 RepID=A0A670ZFH4_PSETE